MERSAIRGKSLDWRESRISLRSIRATCQPGRRQFGCAV